MYENTRRKKRETEEILGVIMSEKLPKLLADTVTDPRISENTKQENYKKSYTYPCDSRIAGY